MKRCNLETSIDTFASYPIPFAAQVVTVALLFAAMGISSVAFAQTTINVKADATETEEGVLGSPGNPFNKISKAIAVAVNGDIILVKPGEYSSELIKISAGVSVIGTDPATTTITSADGGSVIQMNGGTIEGFTITGTDLEVAHGAVIGFGGGIIRDCIITENVTTNGAGIYREAGSAVLLVDGCEITDNVATTGGGIYAAGAIKLVNDCQISGNTAIRGGGVLVSGAGNVELVNCRIFENRAGLGAGIFIQDEDVVGGTVKITDCRIERNKADSLGGRAGGIYIFNKFGNNTTLTMIRSVIANNKAGSAAALHLYNSDQFSGDTGATANLTNCTIVGNIALNGNDEDVGGLDVWTSNQVTLNSCIVWNNTDRDEHQIVSSETFPEDSKGSVIVTYSDVGVPIDDSYPEPDPETMTETNINADPQFLDGTYTLRCTSPCIDTGDPMFTDPDGSRNDMGAFPAEDCPPNCDFPVAELEKPTNGFVYERFGISPGLATGELDWSDVENAVGYRVQIGPCCGYGSEHDIAESKFSYSGLEGRTTYYWRVQAKVATDTYCNYSECYAFTTGPTWFRMFAGKPWFVFLGWLSVPLLLVVVARWGHKKYIGL